MLFNHAPVVVLGGGDLASGVIYRLVKAGFPVIVTELERPLVIRRAVAFASAVFEGEVVIAGIVGRRAQSVTGAQTLAAEGKVPVLVDPEGTSLSAIAPYVLVDGRMAKRNLGTRLTHAPLVIGLGPGFVAGEDCHAVVETKRGHYLGHVIWDGAAQPDTGKPGRIAGRVGERVLRAPAAGHVSTWVAIGDSVREGDPVATVGEQAIVAPFDGVLRGIIHPSVRVTQGMKIGDVDPRGVRDHCFTLSDKALAVGGGVLEAVLSTLNQLEGQ